MHKKDFIVRAEESSVPAMVELQGKIYPDYFNKETPLVCLTFEDEAIEVADVKPISNKKGPAIDFWPYPQMKRLELFSVPKDHIEVEGLEGLSDNLGMKFFFRNGREYTLECEAMNIVPLLVEFLPEHNVEVADCLKVDQ